MTTGSPPASRTCRRPIWKVSTSLSVRPKNAGIPGSAARCRSRSGRAAPSRSEAQASTPASVTACAAVRISVRQSAARARWARSAVRTGSGTVVVSLRAEDTVGARYAASSPLSTDFRRGSPSGPVPGLDDVDGDGAELLWGRQEHGLGRLPYLERGLPAPCGQRRQARIGQDGVGQPTVPAGEQRLDRPGVRQQYAGGGVGGGADHGVGLVPAAPGEALL